VPVPLVYPVPRYGSTTLSPTVETSTCQPCCAHGAGAASGVVAETATTPSRAAGYSTALPVCPSLPAEATTEMPLSRAYRTAVAVTSE
jgi:hypothetical protein